MKKFMIVFSCYKQKIARADNGEMRKTLGNTKKDDTSENKKVFCKP